MFDQYLLDIYYPSNELFMYVLQMLMNSLSNACLKSQMFSKCSLSVPNDVFLYIALHNDVTVFICIIHHYWSSKLAQLDLPRKTDLVAHLNYMIWNWLSYELNNAFSMSFRMRVCQTIVNNCEQFRTIANN